MQQDSVTKGAGTDRTTRIERYRELDGHVVGKHLNQDVEGEQISEPSADGAVMDDSGASRGRKRKINCLITSSWEASEVDESAMKRMKTEAGRVDTKSRELVFVLVPGRAGRRNMKLPFEFWFGGCHRRYGKWRGLKRKWMIGYEG